MNSTRLLRHETLRRLFSFPSRIRLSQSTLREIHYNTQSTFRTRPVKQPVTRLRFPSSLLHPRIKVPNASRLSRRFQSTQADASEANLSVSQRLRKLSREYGWSALGIYLALSALDFPFCFLAVSYLGADRIGQWEHVVLSHVKSWIKWPLSQEGQDRVDGVANEVKAVVKKKVPLGEVREDGEGRILEEEQTMIIEDHGYKEAEKANKGENASMLALFTARKSGEGMNADMPPQVSGHCWRSPTLFTSHSYLSEYR